jgi:cleavage stimulation factor subunit 3
MDTIQLKLDSDSSEEDEEITITPSSVNISFTKQPTSNIQVEKKSFAAESIEFLEYQNAIALNEWDINAWSGLVNEAEHGRGGQLNVIDVCMKAVAKFPRASKYWKKLIDCYLDKDDFISAEDAFKKCLVKCRSVDLWQCYLAMTKKKTIDKYPPSSENYANMKKLYESAFEKALQNVGNASDSHIIWRQYIEFVRDWPEVGALDAGKKLKTLREIYQKAVCNPMEDLDRYWKEYEDLEMKAGEHLAAHLLPEYKPRFNHAKSVFKDRKRFTSKIIQDRLAVPPDFSGNLVELQQLDAWNKWIK